MRVGTQRGAQSPFQILNADTSCKKTRKIRFNIFEALSNFTVFLYTLLNILPRIAWANNFIGHNLAQSPSHQNFWTFSVTSKHLYNYDENTK